MANVLLTTKCNLHCAYCFARERLEERQNELMTVGDAAKVIGFLKRSGHPIFRAMGGEPTLHPLFPTIVEMALAEGLRVDLLSNATWPEAYNALFARISPRRLFFLLNIDHPDNYLPHIWQRIERNLAAVAARGSVTLSFNIFEQKPRYDYLLDLIRRYRIDKLRLSFSLPVVGTQNACLTLDECRKMGPFLVDFIRQVEALGVNAQMDNAFPLCIFSYEEAGELLLKGVIDLKKNARCEPIIDIGPDLTVWCCFCLSRLWNRRLDEFEDLQAIQDYYKRQMGAYQGRYFPMDECQECRYRHQWGCQGGCLSYTIMKHGDVVACDLPASPAAIEWNDEAILAISPEVEIQRYDLPEESFAIYHRPSRVELEVDSSFRPLLELLDGKHTAASVIESFVGTRCDSAADGPLAEFTGRAMRLAARELIQGLCHQGFVYAPSAEARAELGRRDSGRLSDPPGTSPRLPASVSGVSQPLV